jgi:branched-chain amino acid transport system substrate-binding protein
MIYPVIVPPEEPTELQQELEDALEEIDDLNDRISDLEDELAAVPKLEGDIPIGALLSMTGDLQTFGENQKEAIEIARDEINVWLDEAGFDFQIVLLEEDTATDPDIALEKTQALDAQGVKVILGPLASSEVANIKAYADSNDILVISQSSTDPGLAIAGDNVFRFCTDDTIQGPVMATMAESLGLTHVVPVWRQDTWGQGLQQEARSAMEAAGITVAEGIPFDPEVIKAQGFGPEPDSLNSAVSSLVEEHGADKVGDLLISFEEGTDLLDKASEFPTLAEVKWMGSDGTAGSSAVIENTDAAEFADMTDWTNPIFGVTRSPKWDALTEEIRDRLGRAPDSYTYNMYDMLWIVTHSIIHAGEYDTEKIKAVLPQVANNFFGSSGWTVLNEAGDRASADYDLYQVVETDGQRDWMLVGIYSQATGQINWIEEP